VRRYRFLLTPRWLGILAVVLAAAAVMALLGRWQYHRYEERHAVNARIDAAATAPPVHLSSVVPHPGGSAGVAGPPAAAGASYTRVTVTGTYDPANVVLVRGRTVDNRVGYEIVTPLRLADGAAVLVGRGWVPPAPGGATARPEVPATPSGPVVVTGVVRPSESRGTEVTRSPDGRLETRRIAVPRIAAELPYPVYGAFVQLDGQEPAADGAFRPVPADRQNDWLNFGYALQWLLFALLTLVAYGWLAHRRARGRAARRASLWDEDDDGAAGGAPPGAAPGGPGGVAAGRPDGSASSGGAPAEVSPPR
jgi:cytochrome oxidase assembly protein ShyY1